ncbi:hypothetical protein POSPLADRAFT_1158920 [Postia placenta MAD-698-R-SB12]|uniref:Uncharacterized protein n=1 Tax=Postia placenta MAD-698-R-SB12 TaxID=670580 RepID=A0A1X6MK03_9APHY|nr:hypothetical protein POSPLADRAFT_1158920 [Postia placenta MAD-698-R-SB12]OSX56767.1 hypothetical protein POSPLADRAFT_1158920 [Postia placenta MAD-698-R-SB12]
MDNHIIHTHDVAHTLAAEHRSREMSIPTLSDDTASGSESSGESSPPATPIRRLSRASSIYFVDDPEHITTCDDTNITIIEAGAVSSPLEDSIRPLKRRRAVDTKADEVHEKRPLQPDTWSHATKADYGVSFGLEYTPVGDCGDGEPDPVDLALEYVSRSLKRKRCADTRTVEVSMKRARMSGTARDTTMAEDRTTFGIGYIPTHDCTKITVVDSESVHAVFPRIDPYVPLEATARPPKRILCADPTTDEVRIKRRPLSDSPSDASKLKDDHLFGPHPRCMITGCVSAEVEACYILPPDTPQPLVYTYHVIAEDEHPPDSGKPRDDTTTSPVATATSSYRSLGWHDLSANLHLMTVRVGREFIKRPLHYQHLLPTDALVQIPIIRLVHSDAVEPASLHIEQESPVEDMPRPPKRKQCPDTETNEVPAKRVRTASEASKDRIPFGPHPRCMITGCVLYTASRHASAIVNQKIDYMTFNMRTDYDTFLCHKPENIIFLRRDLRELWETNRLLIIPHPQHLKDLEYCTVYKYYVIAEDEHPPDSCATMGHPITPSVMTAPCSYRSLGWHELDADLYSMIFRAGRKLSKRPLHYQQILQELLPHKEINHAYSIISQYVLWTEPLSSEMLPNRRLWATGKLSACPDDYYLRPFTEYCFLPSDDDIFYFPRRPRPIVSGMQRRRSGDTRVDSEACTMEEDAQQVARVRPLAEPEDPELLVYRQKEVRDVRRCRVLTSGLIPHSVTLCTRRTGLEYTQKGLLRSTHHRDWSLRDNGLILASPLFTDEPDVLPGRAWRLLARDGNSRAISCISEFISGGGSGMQPRAWRLSGVDTYHLPSDENIRVLLFNERSPPIWPNGVQLSDIKI